MVRYRVLQMYFNDGEKYADQSVVFANVCNLFFAIILNNLVLNEVTDLFVLGC